MASPSKVVDAVHTGLRYVDVSPPLPETADRTKGYDISLVAVLDEAKDALIYAHHPAHEKYVDTCKPHDSGLGADIGLDGLADVCS